MSNAACEAVIQEYGRELKLAAVVRDYPALCRRARDGGWAYEDLLRELFEAEAVPRDRPGYAQLAPTPPFAAGIPVHTVHDSWASWFSFTFPTPPLSTKPGQLP